MAPSLLGTQQRDTADGLRLRDLLNCREVASRSLRDGRFLTQPIPG
jgi:hypothetical protein